MRRLQKQLQRWREPHTLKHILFGREREVEETLSQRGIRSPHGGRLAEGWMAYCLTCGSCLYCSPYRSTVWQTVQAHADDIALSDLRAFGVRLLDRVG